MTNEEFISLLEENIKQVTHHDFDGEIKKAYCRGMLEIGRKAEIISWEEHNILLNKMLKDFIPMTLIQAGIDDDN